MPTNVEKSPIKLSNKVSRNVFDISRRTSFTQKLGELLPVFMTEAIPGDKFQIDLDSFTRTTPLNAPIFSRIREYYDVFFVPYRLLWRDFLLQLFDSHDDLHVGDLVEMPLNSFEFFADIGAQRFGHFQLVSTDVDLHTASPSLPVHKAVGRNTHHWNAVARPSHQTLTLAGRRDPEGLAVLGDGSTGDLNALCLQ